ncbi:alpha/beta hydrolase family protein [Dyella humicola]|uniref:alpha/beta hydrolase family protein n=1 Tax=Dyella humicola TaxID=2992126 RepID=UPI002251272F|nr:prolyl oligopeptidase family serine peptidase [Dyella humicola]
MPAAMASNDAPAITDARCFGGAQEASTVITNLAGVPAMIRIPINVSRPPIVLWHGFGPPDSEQALMTALPLDDVPAIKVYLGLPLFGRRAPAGGKTELVRRQTEDVGLLVFKPIVMGAVDELPAVVRELEQRGCMKAGEKIALFGFSAGAAAVLVSLAEHNVPVSAAVALNPSAGLSASIEAYEHATGRPYAWSRESRALAARTDVAGRSANIATGRPPPALLVLQGSADDVMAQDSLRELDDALRLSYAQAHATGRFKNSVVEGLTHQWANQAGQAEVRRQVADWFDRYP